MIHYIKNGEKKFMKEIALPANGRDAKLKTNSTPITLKNGAIILL